MVKMQGPLRAYSTRSMERSIGKFSRLINSKRHGGRNASNLVERLSIRNYVNCIIDVDDLINPIRPRQYAESSYLNHPDRPSGAQLWEPFVNAVLEDDDEEVEGLPKKAIAKALLKYYQRLFSDSRLRSFHNNELLLASRLWKDSTVISSCMYRNKRRETSRGNQYIMFWSSHKTYVPSFHIV